VERFVKLRLAGHSLEYWLAVLIAEKFPAAAGVLKDWSVARIAAQSTGPRPARYSECLKFGVALS
jgi:hypothetical protein